MAITAKSKGDSRELVPAGNYFGVCVGVFDIGTQPSDKYDPTHKVILQFELHRKKGVLRDKSDRPLTIGGFYPLAFGKRKNGEKAKLRQAVEGILGRSFTDAEAKDGFDVGELLEMGCRLTVAHDKGDNGDYDTIQSFMPLDEDDPKMAPESDAVLYELDPSEEIPEEVPEWVQRQIKRSIEWVKANGQSEEKRGDRDRKPARASVGSGNGKPPRRRDEDDDDNDVPF